MSLLNEVLRDLDQRRKNTPGVGEPLLPADNGRSSETGRVQKMLRGVLAGVLVLLVLLSAAWFFLLRDGEDTVEPRLMHSRALPEADAPETRSPLDHLTEEDMLALRELLQSQQQLAAATEQPGSDRPKRVMAAEILAVSAVSGQGAAGSGQQEVGTTPQPNPEAAAAPARDPLRPARITKSAQRTEPGNKPDMPQPDERQPEARASGEGTPSLSELAAAASASRDDRNGRIDEASSAAGPGGAAAGIKSSRERSFAEQERKVVQQALGMWNEGRQDTALDALAEFVASNPEAHRSRETLVKLQLRGGDRAAAQAGVEEGLAVASHHLGYRKIKARILLGEGRAAEAADLLSSRAPAIGRDPEFFDLLASAKLSARAYQDAIGTYRLLIEDDRQGETNPDLARWWYGMAVAHDAIGNSAQASESYRRALSLPNLSPNLRQRGRERLSELGQ